MSNSIKIEAWMTGNNPKTIHARIEVDQEKVETIGPEELDAFMDELAFKLRARLEVMKTYPSMTLEEFTRS